MVLIPSNVIHASTSAWGPSCVGSGFPTFHAQERTLLLVQQRGKHRTRSVRLVGLLMNLCPWTTLCELGDHSDHSYHADAVRD